MCVRRDDYIIYYIIYYILSYNVAQITEKSNSGYDKSQTRPSIGLHNHVSSQCTYGFLPMTERAYNGHMSVRSVRFFHIKWAVRCMRCMPGHEMVQGCTMERWQRQCEAVKT